MKDRWRMLGKCEAGTCNKCAAGPHLWVVLVLKVVVAVGVRPLEDAPALNHLGVVWGGGQEGKAGQATAGRVAE